MGVDGLGEPRPGAETEPQVPSQGGRGIPAQWDRFDSGVLPPRAPSDADLIERMRSGGDSAYEELYRRHAEAVRRYARTCCRDAHTADDLTAEVFARMLQAVRGGSGPEHAVRAYLLTSVRRVAATWTSSARREQLVDDFAVFAAQASRGAAVSDTDTLDLGAEVRAMHEAEQSMAMRAFRSLPERWQAVLWHTEVEDESPSEVAPLFGLDANGTRVLASRAREGLKQAYLQAHVSATLAGNAGECGRYADRLGAYARGSLRTRAERGCALIWRSARRGKLAAGQIKDVASGIPAVVPVAVIGWFGAAGYAKVAALVAGGAGAGAAGAAATVSGGSGGAGAGGGAAAEWLGAPTKAGIAVSVAGMVAAAVALALAGDDVEPKEPCGQAVRLAARRGRAGAGSLDAAGGGAGRRARPRWWCRCPGRCRHRHHRPRRRGLSHRLRPRSRRPRPRRPRLPRRRSRRPRRPRRPLPHPRRLPRPSISGTSCGTASSATAPSRRCGSRRAVGSGSGTGCRSPGSGTRTG